MIDPHPVGRALLLRSDHFVETAVNAPVQLEALKVELFDKVGIFIEVETERFRAAQGNEPVHAAVKVGDADEIIAVGKNAKYVLSGVKGRAKGVLVNNLKEAEEELKRSLKSGDAVLFLNDVPDKYGV